MSGRNGDKARFYRLRKKKLLRRELQVKSASSHEAGSFPGNSSEKKKSSIA